MILMCVVSCTLVSCSHDKLDLFSGCKSGLFIQQVLSTDWDGNVQSYRDSVEFSFSSYDETVTQVPLRFYVRSMGYVVDYDRPFILSVKTDETTAVEGEDFELTPSEFVIPANQNMAEVRVIVKRTPKLTKQKVDVVLELQPNEYFELPIETYKNTVNWSDDDATINSATTYKIRFGEIYNRPTYWGWYGDTYWGTFTVAKYLELNKCMGWTVNDWNNSGTTGSKITYGRLEYSALAFQKYLQALANAGTPVTEEDGSYMQLPSAYAVDYSAYTNQ